MHLSDDDLDFGEVELAEAWEDLYLSNSFDSGSGRSAMC